MRQSTVTVGPCVCGGYGILKPEGSTPCHESLAPGAGRRALCLLAVLLALALPACTSPIAEYSNDNGPRGKESLRIGGGSVAPVCRGARCAAPDHAPAAAPR